MAYSICQFQNWNGRGIPVQFATVRVLELLELVSAVPPTNRTCWNCHSHLPEASSYIERNSARRVVKRITRKPVCTCFWPLARFCWKMSGLSGRNLQQTSEEPLPSPSNTIVLSFIGIVLFFQQVQSHLLMPTHRFRLKNRIGIRFCLTFCNHKKIIALWFCETACPSKKHRDYGPKSGMVL